MSYELSAEYLAASAFRFLDKDAPAARLSEVHAALTAGQTLDLRREAGLLGLAAE